MDQRVADDEATKTLPAATRPGGRRYSSSRSGGRRHSSSGLAPARRAPARRARAWSSSASERPGDEATSFPGRMASAGMLGGVLSAFLASCLLAAWLHSDVVAGLGFCAATCVAARCARPQALLGLVVSVPALFLAATAVAQLATRPAGTHRGTLLPVAEGTLLTLAGVAPWLFVGTIAGLVIAMCRGLPRCVKDLRTDLTGRRARSRERARRDRWAS